MHEADCDCRICTGAPFDLPPAPDRTLVVECDECGHAIYVLFPRPVAGDREAVAEAIYECGRKHFTPRAARDEEANRTRWPDLDHRWQDFYLALADAALAALQQPPED